MTTSDTVEEPQMSDNAPKLFSLNPTGNRLITSIVGILMVLLIGLTDYLTGRDLSVTAFYFVPIALVTWRVGKYAGIAVASFSALVWLGAELLTSTTYIHPVIHFWNALILAVLFLIMSRLLISLRKSLEREKGLARFDALTGALSVRYFRELAENEIQRSRRYNHIFTVVYLDVDGFKSVNDHLGHAAGDSLLKNLVTHIRGNIRKTDILVRLGGDEFAILFPETDQKPALQVLEKIRGGLAEKMRQQDLQVTFSMGVVTFHKPPASVDEMIAKPDHLMYIAKKLGKDGVQSAVETA